MPEIEIDQIPIELEYRNIKRMRLSVHLPTSQVKIVAHPRINIANIKSFLISKLNWIKKQQAKRKEKIVREAYLSRTELQTIAQNYIHKWQPIMNVEVSELRIRKMKTRWGTCNTRAKRIWLSLELDKQPLHCIEYVIVHEMVHLLERSHNARFKAFMDSYLPEWRSIKSELNA